MEHHPRIRGEHTLARIDLGELLRSSPHTRGAHVNARTRWPAVGIIPAYAGSTPPEHGADPELCNHPRIRGEHTQANSHPFSRRQSSPHTRGAHEWIGHAMELAEIIPAYAGSTRTGTCISSIGYSSSPHTRGAHSNPPLKLGKLPIIPAYAGSTQRCSLRCRNESDHPRIRGEHTPRPRGKPEPTRSSPHTRGAHSSGDIRYGTASIIPAYAGSTHRHDGRGVHARHHPRIRGEHTLGNPCNTKDRRRDCTSFPLPVTHPSGGGGS